MTTVRKATPEDIPALLAMGRAMHAESPRFAPLDYSDEKVLRLVERLLRVPKAGGILVAEAEGMIQGMLVFYVGKHFFGDDDFAADICVYVTPAHRGGSAFFRLLDAFEAWATSLGVKEMILGTSTGVHQARTVALLQHAGYEQFSTGLLKKV